jgi:hypothetical protein
MGYANPAAIERSLPSAMKSRPKLPRTPGDFDFEQPKSKAQVKRFEPDQE